MEDFSHVYEGSMNISQKRVKEKTLSYRLHQSDSCRQSGTLNVMSLYQLFHKIEVQKEPIEECYSYYSDLSYEESMVKSS
jgi:hypothetical protein